MNVIKVIFIHLFLAFIVNLHSQTLNNGKNKFIYSSQKNKNKLLLQELNKLNDSTLIVKSTIITFKNELYINKLNSFDFDSIFQNQDTSIGIKSKTDLVVENFHIIKRNNIPLNSKILSIENNILITDFHDNLVSDEDEIIFDNPQLKALKRDSLNSIAEFKLPYGFLGFNNYVFLKDFWVIEYEYFRYESDTFVLICHNNTSFNSEFYLKQLNALPKK